MEIVCVVAGANLREGNFYPDLVGKQEPVKSFPADTNFCSGCSVMRTERQPYLPISVYVYPERSSIVSETKAPGNEQNQYDQHLPGRHIAPLVVAQTLFQCGMSVDLTLTGLVGYKLAPSPAMATVPFAAIALGAAAMSAPASYCVKRWGYRTAFLIGAGVATAGGIISAIAIHLSLFFLFALGTLLVGVYQGFANYYRYAAADSAPAQQRSRAISTVLTGGVVAAVTGPFIATATKDVLPAEFGGSYALVAVLAACSAAVLLTWRARPNTAPDEPRDVQPIQARRWFGEFARRPSFLAGVGGTAFGYLTMMVLMTGAPIAAVNHHHTVEQGAFIVQWHMVGMFAPALFSGWLVRRLGSVTVLSTGIALSIAASVTNMLGSSQLHFMVGLLLAGVGWNFMYVAGTTLIASSYGPNDRTRVQALGELLTMGSSAAGSLSAGVLLSTLGWTWLNALMLAPLLACLALAVHHTRARTRSALP